MYSDMRSELLVYQPIYARSRAIAGGRLLVREGRALSAQTITQSCSPDELFTIYSSVSEQSSWCQYPVFVHMDEAFFCAQESVPVHPADVIIELSIDHEPDSELVSAIWRWRQKGFRIAVSGLDFTTAPPALVNMVDILIVDSAKQSLTQIETFKNQVARVDLVWLVRAAASDADVQAYADLGFSLFESCGLNGQPAQAPDPFIDTLQHIFLQPTDEATLISMLEQDTDISLQLLKIANSSLYPGRHTLLSLPQAVARMGARQTKVWWLLLQCTQLTSMAITHLIFSRAQTCAEVLALLRHSPFKPEDAFLAGLLSGVEVMVPSVTKQQFWDELDVPVHIREAALTNRGLLGGIVGSVTRIEKAINGKADEPVSDKVARIYQQESNRIHSVLLGI